MADAEIKFEREGAEGLIAVGSYLSDAARRLGVKIADDCIPAEGVHSCRLGVINGADLLSEPTATERELLSAQISEANERLACHAKIEREGEIVLMTKEPERPEAESAKMDEADYRKRFEELPLETKLAELVRLEAIALSETLTFVVNSPYKVVDKLMETMAEFGFKLEKAKKESTKPEEHRTNGNASEPEEAAADATDTAEAATSDEAAGT